jgi:hypothetical protein
VSKVQDDVDIKTNVEGTEAAQAALDKIATAMERIADRGQKAGEHGQTGLKKIFEQAGEIALGMLGLESAMAVVEKAWETFMAEIERKLEYFKQQGEATNQLGEAERKLARVTAPGGEAAAAAALSDLGTRGIGSYSQVGTALEQAINGRDLAGQERAISLAKDLATARPETFSAGSAGQILSELMYWIKNSPGNVSNQQAIATFGAAYRATGGQPGLREAVDMEHLFGDRDDPTSFLATQAGLARRLGSAEEGTKFSRMITTRLFQRATAAGFKGDSAEMQQWLRDTPEGRQVLADMEGAMADQDEEEAGFGKGAIPAGRGGQYFATGLEYLKWIGGKPTEAGRQIEEAQRRLSRDPVAEERARAAELEASRTQRGVDTVEAFKGAGAAGLDSNPTSAEAGRLRDLLKQNLTKWGVGWLEEKKILTLFDAESLAAGSAQEIDEYTRRIVGRIRVQKEGEFYGTAVGRGAALPDQFSNDEEMQQWERRNFSEQENRLLDKLDELITQLQKPTQFESSDGQSIRARSPAEGAGQ